jgi:hypothetical protein
MEAKQKEAHLRRVHECLMNRRASVISELESQRAAAERSRRVRGRDPIYGQEEIERRALERVAELERELAEINDRLLSGA